jgi:tetratricopeptide (TPR) repeat protein
MSSAAEEETAADKDVCANCGIAGVDEIKLQECHDCDLVKYCSEKCRGEHREHNEECKKRANELHDKRLFAQPNGTHRGECPICFLPMPLEGQSTFMSCCGQTSCKGCIYANYISNIHDELKASRCVFCRTSASDEEEHSKRKRERVEANDPAALRYRGSECHQAGDYVKAFEYYSKAAELGNAEAHFQLGCLYWDGKGVEKDMEKAVYHYEKAAIGGHPTARYMLGLHEGANGRYERAAKHWIIAANIGCGDSMKELLEAYKNGYITKGDYGATLRTHQAAINATKSSQREAAERIGI